VFAWVETIVGQSKAKHRGLDRVCWHFTLATGAYNLIRLSKLPGERLSLGLRGSRDTGNLVSL
jgi:hypothetical protein